jgi:23S rRNA pseudouridine1911/1915/1917 synthase
MNTLFEIIYEDERLLVVNKPADLVCHPTKGDVYSSLVSRMRLHLGEGSNPQLINRLDRETSGVLLAAKDAVTARELRRLWEARQPLKEYLAIVHGHLREDCGVVEAPLGRDEASPVAIKDCVRTDGAACKTEFAVLKRFERAVRPFASAKTPGSAGELPEPAGPNQPFTLLQVILHTGRKHQIRIHLAHLGHPIVGDKIYGGDERIYLDFVEKRMTEAQRARMLLPNQALHAARTVIHWRDREWDFRAEPEPWFREFAGI